MLIEPMRIRLSIRKNFPRCHRIHMITTNTEAIIYSNEHRSALKNYFALFIYDGDKDIDSACMAFMENGQGRDEIEKRLQPNESGYQCSLRSYHQNDYQFHNNRIEDSRKTFLNTDLPDEYFRRLAFLFSALDGHTGLRKKNPRFPVASVFGRYLGNKVSNELTFATVQRWYAIDQIMTEREILEYLIEFGLTGTSGNQLTDHHLRWVAGWKVVLESNRDFVDRFLESKNSQAHGYFWNFASRHQFDFGPSRPSLVKGLATNTSKEFRNSVLEILKQEPTESFNLLASYLSDPSSATRTNVAHALFELDAKSADKLFRDRIPNEKNKSLRETLERMLQPLDASTASNETSISLSPIKVDMGSVPIPDSDKQELASRMEQWVEKTRQAIIRRHIENAKQWGTGTPNVEEISNSVTTPTSFRPFFPMLMELIEGGSSNTKISSSSALSSLIASQFIQFLMEEPVEPAIRVIHVMRLIHLGGLEDYRYAYVYPLISKYMVQERRADPGFSFRHLIAIHDSIPDTSRSSFLSRAMKELSEDESAMGFDSSELWEGFWENSDLLSEVLANYTSSTSQYLNDPMFLGILRVLKGFPTLKREHLSMLWQYAFGSRTFLRRDVQRILKDQPDIEEQLKKSIASSQKDIRQAAASWLAIQPRKSLVQDLRAAYKKEKSEPVKIEILKALERSGVDLSELMDRQVLQAEAEAGLKKMKRNVDWLDWGSLPTLRWKETQAPVSNEILRWLILQPVALNSAVASPMLKKWLQEFVPEDAQQLASELLNRWLKGCTPSGYWKSALSDKGLLAFSSALCDRTTVATAHAYLKEHYGMRVGDCRALLDMASGSDSPDGLHFLKKISQGFRTKSLQSHAQKLIQQMAEDRGWSKDEFEDRMIADGGFAIAEGVLKAPYDKRPTLELDYGARKLYVVLDDELSCIVVTEEGKVLKNLPTAAQGDDEELVKAAKKNLSACKKTVKDVLAVESRRLYEAMCSQREWLASDWLSHLVPHPIVGTLCQRLVWTSWEAEASNAAKDESDGDRKYLRSFRPLADRTLVDAQDNQYKLSSDTLVRVAHRSTLTPEEANHWYEHLEDYEIIPTFLQLQQFKEFTPESLAADSIDDFHGYLINAFKLKRAAEKLGFARGSAEDGGYFSTYIKPFPSMELEAILVFSGNSLPEQDGLVALQQLQIVRKRATGAITRPLPLHRIPKVLLGECHSYLKQIAEAGDGYDAGWESKVLFR